MKRGGGVSGAVSLVMIFCVLCMAVFSVLALATAAREESLAALTAERAASYYEADRQAVEIVAALQAGGDVQADITYTSTPAGTQAEFTLPAGGELSLEVCVLLNGKSCEILRWRTVYSGDWAADDTIELWDGF